MGLALVANFLILLALLGLDASRSDSTKPFIPFVVDLLPAPAEPAPRPATVARESADLTRPTPPRAPPVKPALPAKFPLDMLILTKEEFAAADISKLPKSSDPGGSADGDSEEVGRGPDGQILYGAEWARKPTDTELAGYLPRNAPQGWGLIACRTIPGHRVEDCVELENYPAGSRLAGAVRQAAWQFRVRPPRRNGREMVGAWVQIRIEYLHIKAR